MTEINEVEANFSITITEYFLHQTPHACSVYNSVEMTSKIGEKAICRVYSLPKKEIQQRQAISFLLTV